MLCSGCITNSRKHIRDCIADLHAVNLLQLCALPTGLLHSGDLAFISKLSEAYTANAVLAKISMWAAADFASVILSC